MNLSKLTNPITESDVSSPVPDHFTEEDGINNNTDKNSTEADIKSIGSNQEKTSVLPNTSNAKERSLFEYKQLYSYLFSKFRYATQTTKVIQDFENHLKKLAKYQQLRNNMIIDILEYLNDHESLKEKTFLNSMDDSTNHNGIIEKLNNIIEKNGTLFLDENIGILLDKLAALEKVESNVDSTTNLSQFKSIVGIDEHLTNGLIMEEISTAPDLYNPSKFNLFELIKKNQVFENKTTSFSQKNEQIEKELIDSVLNVNDLNSKSNNSANNGNGTNSKKRVRSDNNLAVTNPAVITESAGVISKPKVSTKKVKLETSEKV